MKALLIKIVAFLGPFLILGAALAMQLNSAEMREGVFDPVLEAKFRELLKPDVEVVMAGDSRMERGVAPNVIEALTGYKTVNVAVTAGDLITLRNAVWRHGLPKGTRILIVSVSLFQINDSAIEPGYISTPCLLNMTLREKVEVHQDALSQLLHDMIAVYLNKEGSPQTLTEDAVQEKGFHPVGAKLKLPVTIILDPKTTNHPWYRNLSLRGARWRIFRQALRDLAASNLSIYLVAPPISPAWRDYTAGSFIDIGERDLVDMLRAEASLYPNVRLLDFYSLPNDSLTNEDFYDIQHLNRSGAQEFSKILAERITTDRLEHPDSHR